MTSTVRLPAIVLFAVAAFILTWTTGLPVVLSDQADLVGGAHIIEHPLVLPFAVALLLITIGGFGPAFAATLITAFESGWAGVRGLLAQVLRWRVSLGWYGVALLGPSALGLLALGSQIALSGRVPTHWLRVPTPFQLAAVFFGPWGEEIGWRGFAQPTLQRRFGSFTASVLVAVMWFLWHQWPLLTPAGPSQIDFFELGTFFLYLLAASVLMAWLYNGTGGSLPIAWVAHTGLNLNVVARGPVPFAYTVAFFCLSAVLVLLWNRPST